MFPNKLSLHALIATTLMVAVSLLGPNATINAAEPTGHTLIVLDYLDGDNWQAGKGPGEQDMQGHFSYVGALSKSGKLVGNGLIEDARPHGLYLLSVPSKKDAEAIVRDDPATANKVLRAQPLKTWLVMMDGFGHANKTKGSFFVLDYEHGPNWRAGLPLMEQDVSHHLAYVSGLFASGRLIGGGPILEKNRGMYLIKTPHRAMAEGIVRDDPAVQAGVFSVTIREWSPGQLLSL